MAWLSSLGSAAGAAGSAIGSGLGAAGSALGQGASALGQGAASAAQAIPSALGSMAQQGGPSGYLASLMTDYANQGLLPMGQAGPPAPQTGMQQAAGFGAQLLQNPGLQALATAAGSPITQPQQRPYLNSGYPGYPEGSHKLRI